MLRGVSLAPQQRFAKDTQELPTELVNSIIGVSARAVPDYGAAAATSGPAALSTSGQQVYGGGGGGAAAPASPSLLTRIFRCARRRYHTTVNGEVPVFDANGNLTTYQTGVNMFRFRSLSLFYFFRAQPWTALITYSILLYLLIVLFITAAYYLWGMYCGAGLNLVASIYFTVVSLAANGGYLGEDEDTMTDSTHMCYRGRTFIVMVCSYVNIVFVGLVAALVVGKAEYTGKLGHRVVFSDFCTLTSIPGRVGQYRLSFRMANVDNNIPLAHGQLRLFCVTAELLREYRLRQKQMHLLKNSAPMKSLTRTTHGSAQQLLPGGETTNSTPQLTESMLEGRRASHQKHKAHPSKNARGPQGDAATPAVVAAALMPPRTLSGVEKDLQTTRAQQPRRRNLHSRTRKEQSATPGTASRASAKKLANSGSGSRVRRGRGRSDPNDDEEEEEAGSSPPPSGTATRTSTPSSASAPASRSSSSSTSYASETRGLLKTQSGSSPATTTARAQAAAAAAAAVAAPAAGSDVTNSSMTSKQNSDLYAASPVGGVAGSFAGPSTGRGAVSPASMTAPRGANSGGVQVRGEEDDHDMDRVHLRVQEMRWTCAEETYLDHGDSGQLSLWYPATITHVIDERSPLFAFMQQPAVAASLKDGPATVFGSARSNDSSVHPPSLRNGADAARHRFQLVAVFDATEMEAGSTITAKHTYTTVNIVAHYKFSDRLVHMQADSGEVMLDFHYFNALLPVDLIELSTTDSEM